MTLSDFPNELPAITLDFLNSRQLDPRINFSRASDATTTPYPTVGEGSGLHNGQIYEFQENVPRLTDQGLLIEESRTNTWTLSGDPESTFGSQVNATVVNGVTAPDGSNNAATMTITAAAGSARTFSNNIAIAGSVWTGSLFVKAGTVSSGYFNYNGKANTNFDLTANNGQGSADGTGTITPVGNGWYRITTTYDATSDINRGLKIGFSGSANDTMFIWGTQNEEGGYASSYIPTSGSGATRAADVATMPAAYNVHENTIINQDFGVAGGSDTLTIVGAGTTPAKRTAVYNGHLTQEQTNAVAGVDSWWEWRVVGGTFNIKGNLAGTLYVDWGDSSAIESFTSNPDTTHTFLNGSGYHTIKLRLDPGSTYNPSFNQFNTSSSQVISIGPPLPGFLPGFDQCTNLETIDARFDIGTSASLDTAFRSCQELLSFPWMDTSNVTSMGNTWGQCKKLTTFPSIDTSNVKSMAGGTWDNCISLTEMPWIDTSSVVNSMSYNWRQCSALTSFPLIDTSGVTDLTTTWQYCSGLTSFPLIDTSNVTSFNQTWQYCSGLTSFPTIDTSSGDNFNATWQQCKDLISFPAIDTSSGTNFQAAWSNCTNLTTFPANFFDSWTGTPANNCFLNTWLSCSSLTATSVENILNSIDTSGQSAPASGVDITIDYNTGTGTPSITTAVTNLKSRNWTITLNGVAQ